MPQPSLNGKGLHPELLHPVCRELVSAMHRFASHPSTFGPDELVCPAVELQGPEDKRMTWGQLKTLLEVCRDPIGAGAENGTDRGYVKAIKNSLGKGGGRLHSSLPVTERFLACQEMTA